MRSAKIITTALAGTVLTGLVLTGCGSDKTPAKTANVSVTTQKTADSPAWQNFKVVWNMDFIRTPHDPSYCPLGTTSPLEEIKDAAPDAQAAALVDKFSPEWINFTADGCSGFNPATAPNSTGAQITALIDSHFK